MHNQVPIALRMVYYVLMAHDIRKDAEVLLYICNLGIDGQIDSVGDLKRYVLRGYTNREDR